ncbi:hypothetical protein B0F90DRAFT_1669486 [Multifurca ochricompacta]|uniref:Uncharacterized protein n=1 Tax=Multifurca ochricompacta TaxID=376703 RepID=A0AAD4QLU5_9AGAM|nr:hypothetical protein B0F90DRAFT_1669486 [Multifurca ochricompacta]
MSEPSFRSGYTVSRYEGGSGVCRWFAFAVLLSSLGGKRWGETKGKKSNFFWSGSSLAGLSGTVGVGRRRDEGKGKEKRKETGIHPPVQVVSTADNENGGRALGFRGAAVWVCDFVATGRGNWGRF